MVTDRIFSLVSPQSLQLPRSCINGNSIDSCLAVFQRFPSGSSSTHSLKHHQAPTEAAGHAGSTLYRSMPRREHDTMTTARRTRARRLPPRRGLSLLAAKKQETCCTGDGESSRLVSRVHRPRKEPAGKQPWAAGRAPLVRASRRNTRTAPALSARMVVAGG
jgi:hypothetical protein